MQAKWTHLIFDLDDTLLDFQATEEKALQQLMLRHGLEASVEEVALYKKMNRELWRQLEEQEITREKLLLTRFSAFFAAVGRQVDGQALDKEYRGLLNQGTDVLPGAQKVLATLKDHGYRILAGTNGVGETQRTRLAATDFARYFDALYISEEVGFEKPDVRFYETIFQAEGEEDRGNYLMIGDSLASDIRGANRAGIQSIWLNPKGTAVPEGIHPNATIQTISEVLNYFPAT